jgi:hypothetical protein
VIVHAFGDSLATGYQFVHEEMAGLKFRAGFTVHFALF